MKEVWIILLIILISFIYICKNTNDNVVILGNGPSLLGKNLGSKIDSFDNIIRANKFKIKGFEKDVGSKTTGWHVNDNINLDWIRNKIKTDNLELNWVGSRKTENLKQIFPFVEKYSFKTKYNDCRKFTSGTLAILHWIEKGYNPVYIAGISGSSGSYYFDNSSKTVNFNKKNIEKFHCTNDEESDLIETLIKEGKVKILDQNGV